MDYFESTSPGSTSSVQKPGESKLEELDGVANLLAHEAVIDANVLLRFLTDSPRELADRASEILETAERERIAVVIAPITIAEVVLVLESVYDWIRADIAEGLLKFIDASALHVLELQVVSRALVLYRDHRNLHFADAYIASVAISRGHRNVMSFDRALARNSEINVIADERDFGRH